MEPHGVRVMPFDYYLEQCRKQGIAVDWYAVREDSGINAEGVASYTPIQWGRAYRSLWQLLISFGWLLPHVRRLLGKPLQLSRERFFCSQLVAAAFKYAGYEHAERWITPVTTDPGTIARFTCLEYRGCL